MTTLWSLQSHLAGAAHLLVHRHRLCLSTVWSVPYISWMIHPLPTSCRRRLAHLIRQHPLTMNDRCHCLRCHPATGTILTCSYRRHHVTRPRCLHRVPQLPMTTSLTRRYFLTNLKTCPSCRPSRPHLVASSPTRRAAPRDQPLASSQTLQPRMALPASRARARRSQGQSRSRSHRPSTSNPQESHVRR